MSIAGCATSTEPFIPAPFVKAARPDDLDSAAGKAGQVSPADQPETTPRETAFYKTPPLPKMGRMTAGSPAPSPTAPPDDGSKPLDAAISLENLPLPQFVNAIFASILKRNVSMDPRVLARNDMVSLRTGKPQTAEQLSVAAKAVLRSYGVVVSEYDGLVRVTLDNAQSNTLPEIRRGRASPDVPGALRPVFYLAEFEHTSSAQTAATLRILFPNKLTVQDDIPHNAILISGQSDTVAAALETIQMLDQPLMRGRHSVRIAPVFWTADEMTKRLVDLLGAEGYFVGQSTGSTAPLLIIPVPPINSIVMFAANEQMLNHALRWARELDQPNQARAKTGGYITYFVRNTDAADLAKTLNEVISGAPPAAAPLAGTPVSVGAQAPRSGGRVVVNASANSLIIQGSETEFQQLRGLLEELDRPARSALVMATVAEVYLDSSETFNFNWMLKEFSKHGYTYNVGTTNGSALGIAASNFSILLSGPAGDPRAMFSALASDNKIRILSNPSIMARSGETATIQVGSQVPIITSQISNASTGTFSGSSGILQTVQYVQTGVILRVKPVVHAGGRIDLEVSQEVSSAGANTNGGTTSPVISNKKVDTKLSVSDGNTVLLGGLISEENNANKTGIPGLKDIPLLGALFQTENTKSTNRTELVIMLTAYTLEDDFDARSITEAFRAQFPWAANVPALSTPRPALETLPQQDESTSAEPTPPTSTQGEGYSHVVPISPSRDVPQNKKPASGAAASLSQPYRLPEQDSPPADGLNVAPIQHPTGIQAPSVTTAPLPSAPIVVDSATGSNFSPPLGKPVTDEKLKQELLDLFQPNANAKKP
jgi:general secretion pathway protein D